MARVWMCECVCLDSEVGVFASYREAGEERQTWFPDF